MYLIVRLLVVSAIYVLTASAQQPGPGIPNVAYPADKVGTLISDDNGYQETLALALPDQE